jgi:hypothetical protein
MVKSVPKRLFNVGYFAPVLQPSLTLCCVCFDNKYYCHVDTKFSLPDLV